MKIALTSFFVLFTFVASSQYYYNDIVGTGETNQQMAQFVVNKVKTVSATGYDQRGAKATDFSELYEVKENGKVLKCSEFSNFNKTVTYSHFNAAGRLVSISDSSNTVSNTTTYEYDENGMLIKVENTVKDSSGNFNHRETHIWLYQENNQPVTMWRLITQDRINEKTDSLEIRFLLDDDGNVAEERTYRNGRETGYIYYYHDDKNRLTDIVRYNTKVKKLMPDIMFEYDENNRVIQKITTTSSQQLGYLIWRYVYDAEGLKTKEALFNNDKQLTGKIEYNYTY
jgi:YD repeat-containing protein